MSMPLFAAFHENLKNDYDNGSGVYSESCRFVANSMAGALKNEGRTPRILGLRGEKNPLDGNNASLFPAPFEGRVKWGTHLVCEAAGIIYDPMLPKPLPLEEYLLVAFNQAVEYQDRSDLLDR